MFRLPFKIGVTMLSTVAAVVIGLSTTSSAHAKQCIWNKAGFVLNVQWYRPNSVVKGNNGRFYVKRGHRPVQTDIYPIAQGRCNKTSERRVAVLRIEGREWVKKGLQIGSGVAATAITGVASAVACGASAGTACPAAVSAATAAVGGVVTVAGEFIPEPKDIGDGAFAIIQPPTNHWIDVWGTVWDPQTGRGGNF